MVPEGNIVNAMKVAPSQQVMLRVRFLEVARTASREIGVNWFGANNAGNRGFSDRPGHGLRGGQTCYRPDATFRAVGRRPVLTRAETRYPHPVRPLAAGHLAFRYSILWGLCLSGAAPFGVALASLATKGGSLDVTLSALERRASSDAWPSRTWLHSPVTPPPSWRAANFRCRRATGKRRRRADHHHPNASPSA